MCRRRRRCCCFAACKNLVMAMRNSEEREREGREMSASDGNWIERWRQTQLKKKILFSPFFPFFYLTHTHIYFLFLFVYS